MQDKIKPFIKKENNNSGNCDDKYLKISVNSDNELPLENIILMQNLMALIRLLFKDKNKYFLRIFLRRFWYIISY